MGTAKRRGLNPFAVPAAGNLRVDHMTAEVLRVFEHAGVASILLKGPSTVRWLYPNEPRRYQDCDLLVSPATRVDAGEALRGLGFVPKIEESRMPGWWHEHAVHWLHPEWPATLDVHHTLTGVGVGDTQLWGVLSTNSEVMLVGGFPASVLSLPGRALHVTLHAAQHAGELRDLTRALARAGEEQWRAAARLADELDATAAFSAGLRLVPQGEELAARLDLPAPRSVEAALRTTGAPPQAFTVERFARASGPRERLAMVRHKLLPPPTYMRHWSTRARGGRLALLVAYGQRMGWVARKTPRAICAWRRARRAAQENPPTGV